MEYPINYNKFNTSVEFYSEMIDLYHEARDYLMAFKWCASIYDCDLYLNLGSVLCVFTFKIENTASSDDNSLWVIVGDIPAMYLGTHGARTLKEALDDYVYLANEWASKVMRGESTANCYPFNSQPTLEMAELLEQKTSFIKNTLLDEIDDIQLEST